MTRATRRYKYPGDTVCLHNHMKAADSIYDKWDEPQHSCLLAMRQIILSMDSNISETVKYGLPCFCYGSKHFCYLNTIKKTNAPYILMVDGNRIDHPMLEQGDRKRMKILVVNPEEDLPVDSIKEVLEMALKLHS